MFPRNVWYVACRSEEIGNSPFARTICNEKVVFFRDAAGEVAALEDFCPHRGLPLSLGRVCKGQLTCGYHGLTVDCHGKTVSMPDQRVRGFPAVRVFPTEERHGFIWIWVGDPAQADTATIHEPLWASNPSWAYGGGVYHIKSDYRLMIDNLMDLTHETYVHESSIGQREIDETPCSTKVDGDKVITSRFMSGIIAPPFLQFALRMNGLPDCEPVDRWQICTFTPPCHVMIEVGVALAGNGGYTAPDNTKVSAVVVDYITPETDTSHWYFWGMARSFKPEDAELTRDIQTKQGGIFAEDKIILEQQQESLSRFPERKLLMLNIDSGGVQSRKILERLVAAECS
jgi:vanillate O-demethylase monooxygenase subunit